MATHFIDGVVIQTYLENVNGCTRVSKLILTDKGVKSVLSMYQYIKIKEIECMFSNVEIILNVLILILSTAVSNSSGERGFPGFKRVKPYFRSTMKEVKLHYKKIAMESILVVFSIEPELVGKLEFNDTINTFTHQKNKNKNKSITNLCLYCFFFFFLYNNMVILYFLYF